MNNPWLNWSVFLSIGKHARFCGELCSVRFTWERPRKSASTEKVFIEESFLRFLHLAQELAHAPLKKLHAVKAQDANILYALAEFENRVAAEFEMNEALPDSMPDVFFIKANFTGGHVTNQPLGGHFDEPGSIFADENGLSLFTVDSCDPEIAGGVYDTVMKTAELEGAPEIPDAEKLLAAVRKAVYR
ncbi:MAG: hypothetical protein IJT50_16040 [Lentisphaeria bacterium]|nr:hypothetical protein [Lentisphaeria bacterium]